MGDLGLTHSVHQEEASNELLLKFSSQAEEASLAPSRSRCAASPRRGTGTSGDDELTGCGLMG